MVQAMGLRDMIFGRRAAPAEQRDLSWMDVPWSPSSVAFDGGGSAADRALRLIPVYGAVGMIADAMASLPVHVYRASAGGRREQADAPVWLGRPDYRVSRFDWVHQCMASLLLRGNAYGLVSRSPLGVVIGVEWIHPDKVMVDESAATPVYRIGAAAFTEVSAGGRILHIRGFVVPGTVVGLSPVGLFRRQFHTLDSATTFAEEWFDGRAIPSGILKNAAATLNAEQTKVAKGQFTQSMRTGEPVVLDKNWDWTQLSLSPADALFLDTIKASATQIAVIYRVDPEDVGGVSGNSLKYSTVEGNQRKFNTRTLLAWVTRLEEALLALLEPGEFLRFNLDALARPNLLERARANSEQLMNGTLTLPEARALEDRPPLTDAEIEAWIGWYRTSKGAYAETAPFADLLAQLAQKED